MEPQEPPEVAELESEPPEFRMSESSSPEVEISGAALQDLQLKLLLVNSSLSSPVPLFSIRESIVGSLILAHGVALSGAALLLLRPSR